MVKLDTKIVQLGNRSETLTGTVSAPIYLSTAYRHEGIGNSSGYDYVRTGNPTRELVEKAIADLEGGDQGFACSSGMAAIFTIISLLQSGDELIVSDDIYGGTYRLFEKIYSKFGVKCHYVDTSVVSNITKCINEKTKALFIETPTNPLMVQTDISEVAKITKEYRLLLIVDNTFYTPIVQRPIELGADIVIHSATKYLGGHNDVLGGLESFITYPATQTHMDVPEEVRTERGVCNKLLRFSVGIEDAGDIQNDLIQALEKASKEAILEL